MYFNLTWLLEASRFLETADLPGGAGSLGFAGSLGGAGLFGGALAAGGTK